MHSSHMLREGARPERVWDNMGHANIDVTQNVSGKRAGGPGLRDRKAEKLKSWGDPRLALPRDVGSIPQFLEAHLYSDGKEERI